MRKFLPLFAAICVFTALSCEKEDPRLPCEINNVGGLCVQNLYTDRVTLSINGTDFGIIPTGNTQCQNLSPGNYLVEAVETDAILFPDTWQFTISVVQCENSEATLTP